jgi:hypothetical protein
MPVTFYVSTNDSQLPVKVRKKDTHTAYRFVHGRLYLGNDAYRAVAVAVHRSDTFPVRQLLPLPGLDEPTIALRIGKAEDSRGTRSRGCREEPADDVPYGESRQVGMGDELDRVPR